MSRRFRPLLLMMALAVLAARPVFAGPPLLCFPFEIGAARSLPMGAGGWEAIDRSYDTSRLVADTVALLGPATPVIARMETLRRATLYAATDATLAGQLLDRLQQRAAIPSADAPLAVFDFGYLVETYKQAAFMFRAPVKAAQTIDGYNLVAKAAAMKSDPAMEFALAVMTRGNTRTADAYRTHLARVVKAAATDPAIEANLARHFGNDLAR